MSAKTLFLRMVGRDPEQIIENERFKRNFELMDLHNKQLDEILRSIEQINRTVTKKSVALQQTMKLKNT